MREFAGSRAGGAVSVGLLGSFFQFIEDSTYVRMDSLSLLLNLAAWVAYMGLRRGHFYAAIFCSSGLAATSLVTHPNGIIAFFGILVLAVVLDRSRLSVRS